jgi:hypothetical protein
MLVAPEITALEVAVAERATANLGLPGRTYNEFRVYEDYGMRAGLEDVWGSSPLRLARYARLFAEFPLDRLWRLAGVEHLLTWRRELFEPSTLLAEFPQTSDTTYLHRLAEPNPRAWLVGRVQPATDEEAATLLGDHTFDLEQIALLPPDLLAGSQDAGSPGDYALTLARPAANQIDVSLSSATGGLLVISENWMPGWRLLGPDPQSQISNLRSPIPGLQPLTIYRANLTFLAVPVPTGATHFTLVYWPESVRTGLLISASMAVLLLLAAGWRWWAKGQPS